MNGRELRKANQLTAALEQINRAAASVMQEEQTQAEEIRKCCDAIRLKEARNALSDISVEELRNSKAGIRVSVLQAAGFRDLGALARAGDRELTMIDGIGEGQLSSIRNIISGFLLNLSAHKSIRLTDRNPEKEEAALLLAAARFRRCAVIRKDMQALQKELQAFTEDVIPRVSIRNSFRWVFSGREKKEQTEQAVSEIFSFFDSPAYERISVLLQNRNKAVSVQMEEALQDFRRNGAEYYALVESLGGSGISNDLVYSSIPARMAAALSPVRMTAILSPAKMTAILSPARMMAILSPATTITILSPARTTAMRRLTRRMTVLRKARMLKKHQPMRLSEPANMP